MNGERMNKVKIYNRVVDSLYWVIFTAVILMATFASVSFRLFLMFVNDPSDVAILEGFMPLIIFFVSVILGYGIKVFLIKTNLTPTPGFGELAFKITPILCLIGYHYFVGFKFI